MTPEAIQLELVVAVDVRLQRRITMAMVGLSFLISLLIVGGLFIGFYISDLTGEPDPILYPFIFSTVGLAVAIILSYYVAKRTTTTVGQENRSESVRFRRHRYPESGSR